MDTLEEDTKKRSIKGLSRMFNRDGSEKDFLCFYIDVTINKAKKQRKRGMTW
jgi:hypothetical protein